MLIVSPTEPARIRALGITDLLPEDYGADILFASPTGIVVVQRKTIPDLIASMRDNRLASQIPLLQQADHPILLVEGRPVFTDEGHLLSDRTQFHRIGWYGVCLSLQFAHGIHLITTDSMDDTIAWLKYAPSWFDKPEHTGLLSRSKPTDNLGHMTPRDFAIAVLQCFPGFGPTIATRVYDFFGRVPLIPSPGIDATKLAQVPGVGKTRAQAFMRALEEVAPKPDDTRGNGGNRRGDRRPGGSGESHGGSGTRNRSRRKGAGNG